MATFPPFKREILWWCPDSAEAGETKSVMSALGGKLSLAARIARRQRPLLAQLDRAPGFEPGGGGFSPSERARGLFLAAIEQSRLDCQALRNVPM